MGDQQLVLLNDKIVSRYAKPLHPLNIDECL
jgi:hypothetical protein